MDHYTRLRHEKDKDLRNTLEYVRRAIQCKLYSSHVVLKELPENYLFVNIVTFVICTMF